MISKAVRNQRYKDGVDNALDVYEKINMAQEPTIHKITEEEQLDFEISIKKGSGGYVWNPCGINA